MHHLLVITQYRFEADILGLVQIVLEAQLIPSADKFHGQTPHDNQKTVHQLVG